MIKLDKQYKLAVKVKLTFTVQPLRGAFFIPEGRRVSEGYPFEVYMRALKDIQGIGKGVAALADFCAFVNL